MQKHMWQKRFAVIVMGKRRRRRKKGGHNNAPLPLIGRVTRVKTGALLVWTREEEEFNDFACPPPPPPLSSTPCVSCYAKKKPYTRAWWDLLFGEDCGNYKTRLSCEPGPTTWYIPTTTQWHNGRRLRPFSFGGQSHISHILSFAMIPPADLQEFAFFLLLLLLLLLLRLCLQQEDVSV